MRHVVTLRGVSPETIAGYLKAVALLRIVGEQVDPSASGRWDGDAFVVASPLDADALERFFLETWVPTPIVSPWNRGSGFQDGDPSAGIDAIEGSTEPRLAPYREAIATARVAAAIAPSTTDRGARIRALRAVLPDAAIPWLDAAVVLDRHCAAFPPLVEGGGGDGGADFTQLHLQRVAALLSASTPVAPSRPDARTSRSAHTPDMAIAALLRAALFVAAAHAGREPWHISNPWDYVLALEGVASLAPTAPSVLDATGARGFPFFMRTTRADAPVAAGEVAPCGELWLPLWRAPATAAEIGLLFGGARYWLEGRVAETSMDVARAVRRGGVPRGVYAVHRFPCVRRAAAPFLATTAGRHRVGGGPMADPLAPLDPWLRTLARAAERDPSFPALVRLALRGVESVVIEGDTDREDVTGPGPETLERCSRLLLALGRLSVTLLRSRGHRGVALLPPIPTMPQATWGRLVAGGDARWRLAFLLAQGGLRRELQPIVWRGRWSWGTLEGERELWPDVPLLLRLLRVGERRLARKPLHWATAAAGHASLQDVALLTAGGVDAVALAAAL